LVLFHELNFVQLLEISLFPQVSQDSSVTAGFSDTCNVKSS